jgi:uncharacterized protein YegJ (DUF2314 family)
MFETVIGFIVVGAAVVAFWAYQRSQAAMPQPIPVASDDPEMVAARVKAKVTVDEFRDLYASNPNGAWVKVPVTSSRAVLEWMVGDVVELTDVYVKVQLRGRPATHRGTFQGLQTFPLRDIADWQVCLPNGRYRGGYTQRVHFDRMRARGALAGAVASEAAKYD